MCLRACGSWVVETLGLEAWLLSPNFCSSYVGAASVRELFVCLCGLLSVTVMFTVQPSCVRRCLNLSLLDVSHSDVANKPCTCGSCFVEKVWCCLYFGFKTNFCLWQKPVNGAL